MHIEFKMTDPMFVFLMITISYPGWQEQVVVQKK